MVGNRIKQVRNLLGITQEEFAKQIGRSRLAIARYETGARTPDDTTIKLISEKFGISERWLKTGEGEMFIKIEPNATLIELDALPVVAKVGAGFPQSVGDFDVLYFVPIPKYLSHKYKNCFAVEVHGDSMQPTLEEGDIVVCKPVQDISMLPGSKIVVVADENGELIVKRLKKDKEGNIVLTSDNPSYEPIQPNGHHRIVGQAIELIKRIKV